MFAGLFPEAQTVIASVSFQNGDLATATPNFWAQVTDQDWYAALGNLRKFGDKFGPRRNREADFLQKGMDRLKKFVQPALATLAPEEQRAASLTGRTQPIEETISWALGDG